MMKRLISFFLAAMLLLSLAACGAQPAPSAQPTPEPTPQPGPLTITLPAQLMNGITQEELTERSGDRFAEVTLNEDGSASFTMSAEQHALLMDEVETNIRLKLDGMPASGKLPNVTDVTVSDDFTVFTVTTDSTTLTLAEDLSRMAFYLYGSLYQLFSGVHSDKVFVQVDFINSQTGAVILSDQYHAGN